MPEKKANKTTVNHKKAETNKKIDHEKKVAEVEKKIEEIGAKTDNEVGNLAKKLGFVDKITNASRMKEILNLSFIESANKRVKRNLDVICKVFGWISLVCGCIFSLYSILAFIKGIVHLFQGSIGLLLLSLVLLVLSAFILIISRGWLKMKKRLPDLAIISVLIYFIILIVSIFSAKISFWSYLISLIVSIIVALFVLKNRDMFKN